VTKRGLRSFLGCDNYDNVHNTAIFFFFALRLSVFQPFLSSRTIRSNHGTHGSSQEFVSHFGRTKKSPENAPIVASEFRVL